MHTLGEFYVLKLAWYEYLFLHSFNKYLLIIQNVAAPVLSVGNTLAITRDKVLDFMHVTLQINE